MTFKHVLYIHLYFTQYDLFSDSNNITNKDERTKRVDAGESVTMDCIADGLPRPFFSWSDPNGNAIPSDGDRITILEEIMSYDGVHGTEIKSNLTITNVKTSDYGDYTCVASNSIGQPDMLTVNLNGTSKYFQVYVIYTYVLNSPFTAFKYKRISNIGRLVKKYYLLPRNVLVK